MTIAKIQERGQITIPVEVRKACGIKSGDSLLFVAKGEGVFEARVLPSAELVSELIGRYEVSEVAPDLAELRSEMGKEMTDRVIKKRDTVAEESNSYGD